MADFALIREHPWWTTAIILGGGLVVYIIYERHKAASASATTTTVDATGTSAGGVDPTVLAQLQSQQNQLTAQLQGLTIQGQTQVDLAQIQAGVTTQTAADTQDVTNKQTAATQEVADTQTGAQLQLGIATLNAQTAQDQISAAVQIANINAILAAFGVNNSNTTTTTPVNNSPGNPVQTQLPPATQYTQTPTYNVPGVSNPNPAPVTTPTLNPNNPAAINTTSNGGPLYETNVQGSIAGGGTYGVNSQYYLTPQATQQLASILGTTSSVQPSVVGASGGPFGNPPTEDIATPSGNANAGQMMAELQNTAPGEWSTILAGYGLPNDPTTINSIYNMLGNNQAVPAHA